jgi:hypothetical protein
MSILNVAETELYNTTMACILFLDKSCKLTMPQINEMIYGLIESVFEDYPRVSKLADKHFGK